jgi:hypothetical protein
MGIEQSGAIRVQTATGSFAWALIPTHAHLLLCTGGASIAKVMRRLPIGPAILVNRRHRRSGYRFQSRYNAIVCQKDACPANSSGRSPHQACSVSGR